MENAALSQRSDPLKDCRELTTIELNRAHLHISPRKHIYVFGIAGTRGYGFDVIPPPPPGLNKVNFKYYFLLKKILVYKKLTTIYDYYFPSSF